MQPAQHLFGYAEVWVKRVSLSAHCFSLPRKLAAARDQFPNVPSCRLTKGYIAAVKNRGSAREVIAAGAWYGNYAGKYSRKCVMVIHATIVGAGDPGSVLHPPPFISGEVAGGNHFPYLRNMGLIGFPMIDKKTDLVTPESQLVDKHTSEAAAELGGNTLYNAVGGQPGVRRLLRHPLGEAHVCLTGWVREKDSWVRAPVSGGAQVIQHPAPMGLLFNRVPQQVLLGSLMAPRTSMRRECHVVGAQICLVKYREEDGVVVRKRCRAILQMPNQSTGREGGYSSGNDRLKFLDLGGVHGGSRLGASARAQSKRTCCTIPRWTPAVTVVPERNA
jgi:hypothetical protein